MVFLKEKYLYLLTAMLAASKCSGRVITAQPNPPIWPDTVKIFSPEDDSNSIQAVIDAIYATNGGQDPPENGEFTSNRYALFFKPGSYSVDVPVGYYTSVHGLGGFPDDVVFNSSKGVYSTQASPDYTIGALDTFWRSAENFKNDASYEWWNGVSGSLWAVSQAAPLRRVHITNDLYLFQYENDGAGYASGGYFGDSKVDGTLNSGTQQQWFTRNSEVNEWSGGVWNMVFVGVDGAPTSQCGESSDDEPVWSPELKKRGIEIHMHGKTSTYATQYVTVDQAPLIAEKPFISFDDTTGQYFLNRPRVQSQVSGVLWDNEIDAIDFSEVYVARNETDTAASINAMLQLGFHLVLTPGIYQLEESLEVLYDGQIILGVGFATLIPSKATPVITVRDGLTDVRIASLLLEAGVENSESLLVWGTADSDHRSTETGSVSGVLSDLFARVGGPTPYETQAEMMVQIYSDTVIGDNLWLWRADHSVDGLVYDSANPCATGLLVEGNDVTMYGLAVEHTLNDLTVWNGENGTTFFYQSELPYDVTQDNFGDLGYAGYRVGDEVLAHQAYGIGVYHYFRDYEVIVDTGIAAPSQLEDQFLSSLSVYLNGLGSINHVLNSNGDATNMNSTSSIEWLCEA